MIRSDFEKRFQVKLQLIAPQVVVEDHFRNRSEERGNFKISVSKGYTVQEMGLVTTAYDRETDKQVIEEL